MNPKKTKLKLDTLKISSFITNLDDRQQSLIKTGAKAFGESHPPYCPSEAGVECATSPEAGCESYYGEYCESKDTACWGVCFSMVNNDPCKYDAGVGIIG
jgi:hypothetical protein